MNSPPPNPSTDNAGRETLGTIAKIVAVLAASFAFAAFSTTPDQPQSIAHSGQAAASSQTPNHSR
jgi:hypothetical protein